jgi:hypothetical protein
MKLDFPAALDPITTQNRDNSTSISEKLVTLRQKEGLVTGLKNPEYEIIENHDPVIEIRKVADPEEVRDEQHSAIYREPDYLDDRAQERCPEGDYTHEGEEK